MSIKSDLIGLMSITLLNMHPLLHKNIFHRAEFMEIISAQQA